MSISLVILAAGMGSRFGGDKQIEPIGPNGELIIDYSVMDAVKSGFDNIVFVIKKEIEDIFKETIFKRASMLCPCEYVFQSLNDLPGGVVSAGRMKPWGTGHAVLAARHTIKTPFAVINADDFYGRGAFSELAGFLKPLAQTKEKGRYCMVGYKLKNTVSDHGSVSRGICESDENGYLTTITERCNISVKNGKPVYTEDGLHFYELSPDATVSMNCFGFTADFMSESWRIFGDFLKTGLIDPLKTEFQLPTAAAKLIDEKTATMKLLNCNEKWYGFTYKEDRAAVAKAVAEMTKRGVY